MKSPAFWRGWRGIFWYITSALNLQRRLLEGIDAAKAAESAIFEQSGETGNS